MMREPWRRLAPCAGVTAALAVAIRAIYLQQLSGAPEFLHPVLDAAAHVEWARAFLAGEWPGNEPHFRAPGYVWVLAAALRVVGDDPTRVAAVQLLAGAVTPVLTSLLAGRWFGVGTAWIAGVGAALAPMFLFFDAQLLDPALSVPLVLAAVIALGEAAGTNRARVALVAGLLAGAVAIVRPPLAIAVMLPVFVLLVRRGFCRRRLGAWVAGFALLPLAVTAQNAMRGDAVIVASQGGLNFYLGNGVNADGHSATFAERPDLTGYRIIEAARGIAEAERGAPLRDSEVSAYWTARAAGDIRSDPARWLALLAKKSFLFGFVREIPNNHDAALFAERFPFLRWLPGWGVWLPLGVAGWIAARRRSGAHEVGAVVLGVFVVCVAFFVNARFRVPALPFWIVLAAAGWTAIATRRERIVFAAVAAATAMAFHVNVYGIPTSVWLPSYVLLAEAERARNEPVRALRWTERALEREPGFYAARMLQIELLRGMGRVGDALDIVHAGLAVLPDNVPLLTEHGALLDLAGEPERALVPLDRAIATDPGYDPARVNRAIVLVRLGRTDDAVRELRSLLDGSAGSSAASRAAALLTAIERGELTPLRGK